MLASMWFETLPFRLVLAGPLQQKWGKMKLKGAGERRRAVGARLPR
jgi:hypothetical protein